MSDADALPAIPQRLLLATDLGARCDRALDRAVQLAGEWGAALSAVNVLDTRTSPQQAMAWATGHDDDDTLRVAKRQLARDLAGSGIDASMHIARSADAAAVIRELAGSSGCGLVITGVAGSEFLARLVLGSTVERLARILPQPLLVVRNRVHAEYRSIVVATDFSDSSRHAVLLASRLFPGRELVLYHAYQLPAGSLPNDIAHGRISREIEQREFAAFIASCALPPDVRVRTVVAHGVLEMALAHHVRSHEVELVVLGTHGRSGIRSVLLGSSAAKLLHWLPCDALLVRAHYR
jgi:nucleotide-binding universal stress UspA family protein